MDYTGWSLNERLMQTVLYGLGYMAYGASLGVLGPTLDRIAESIDESVTVMGYLFACRGFGALLGSLFVAKLYDVYDVRIVLSVGVACIGAAMLWVATVPPYLYLVMAHVLLGMGAGVVDTGCNAIIVLVWHGSEWLSPAIQLMHACYGLGSVVVSVGAANLSVMGTYALLGITALLIAVAQLFPVRMRRVSGNVDGSEAPSDMGSDMPHPPVEDTDVEENNHASPSFGHGGHGGAHGGAQNGTVLDESAGRASGRWLSKRKEIVLFVTIILLIYVGSESTFGGLIGTFGTEVLGMSMQEAAYLTSMFWFSFASMRVVSIGLSHFVRDTTLLFLDLIFAMLALLPLAVMPDSRAMAWLSVALIGVSMASIFPASVGVAPDLGVVLSTSYTRYLIFGAAVGEMVIPAIVSYLLEHSGHGAFGWAMIVVLFSALSTFCVLYYRHRPRGPHLLDLMDVEDAPPAVQSGSDIEAPPVESEVEEDDKAASGDQPTSGEGASARESMDRKSSRPSLKSAVREG